MRDELEKQRKLTAEQTSDSYTYLEGVKKVPYIIKFEGMPKQTFVKYENCFKPFNYLISSGED
jgi:hypothetical protein